MPIASLQESDTEKQPEVEEENPVIPEQEVENRKGLDRPVILRSKTGKDTGNCIIELIEDTSQKALLKLKK